jgi:hypothetical protein
MKMQNFSKRKRKKGRSISQLNTCSPTNQEIRAPGVSMTIQDASPTGLTNTKIMINTSHALGPCHCKRELVSLINLRCGWYSSPLRLLLLLLLRQTSTQSSNRSAQVPECAHRYPELSAHPSAAADAPQALGHLPKSPDQARGGALIGFQLPLQTAVFAVFAFSDSPLQRRHPVHKLHPSSEPSDQRMHSKPTGHSHTTR